MDREFVARYVASDDGTIKQFNRNFRFLSLRDRSSEISQELLEEFGSDKNFKIISIDSVSAGDVDFDLSDRMLYVRKICELGNKVRASAAIRNRQPLRTAYVKFSSEKVQNYMQYIDCGNNQFADLIGDELNVFDVVFLDEASSSKVFEYTIKPAFKVLGPKGFGKQAQSLKAYFQSLSSDDRFDLYLRLKSGEVITIQDVPLSISDVEIEYGTKPNYASASSKYGAIVIDTRLDTSLTELGFVSDFRAAIQEIRRNVGLAVTDRIYIELFGPSDKVSIVEKFSFRLKKDLLSTDIKIVEEKDMSDKSHRFEIYDDKLAINLYKEPNE